LSRIDITSCGVTITVPVYQDGIISLVDEQTVTATELREIYIGQEISVPVCDGSINIITIDVTEGVFLAIRDRFNAYIFDRSGDYIRRSP